MKGLFSFAFLFFIVLTSSAQLAPNVDPERAPQPLDTILLNNGKILITQVVDTVGEMVTVIKPNSHKHKKVEIDKEGIFSIRFGSTGKEDMFYTYDTLVGHDYKVDEARKFIEGEQDAQHGFHAVGISIISFTVGVASGATLGGILGLAPPFTLSGFITYPRIKVRHKSVRNKANGTNDAYLYGYDITARRKRTLHSFLWGGIGTIIGIIIHPSIINQ
jgi:hypothetical protein